MEKLVEWVNAFNTIAKNENNFHSFSIEKGEDFVDAVFTIEDVSREGECRVGNFAMATLALRGDAASMEMASGTYKKCPTPAGYSAEYSRQAVEKFDLGNDPELISFIKSMKNEGDFIALLEAVLQTLAH